MALSVALPLSGLDTDSFSTFNLFGFKSILTVPPQGSPSPTSSESSGLGSLFGSLPPSPHESDKAPFSPIPEQQPIEPPPKVVMYRGRDILDLRANLDPAGWQCRPAFLPRNDTTFFFANRSQYHRLAGGAAEEPFATAACPRCGFVCIVH